MAIIRGDLPTDGYTIIDNRWFRDPRLTYKAKGLLGAIASHEAGYRLTVEQLIAETKDGRDAVRAGIAELESVGYLARVPVRSRGNRISGYDFQLTAPTDVGFSGAGKSVDGEPGAGNPAPKKTRVSKKTRVKKTTKDQGAGAPAEKPKNDQSGADPQPVDEPVDDRPEVEALCKLLADAIEANGSKRPTITKGWRTAARLMIDKDGREPAKIERAIAWATSHPFWAANIMSMPKLREKYDTLRLQAQRDGVKAPQTKSFKQQDEERAEARQQANDELRRRAEEILDELVKRGMVKSSQPGQHEPQMDKATGTCTVCQLPESNLRHEVGLNTFDRSAWINRLIIRLKADESANGMASRNPTSYIDGEWSEPAAIGGGAP